MTSHRFRIGRRVAARLGAAVIGLGLVAGPAIAREPDPLLPGGLFAQNQALTFRWASGFAPPADVKTAVRDAADDANTSRKSKAATFAYDADSGNSIFYGADDPCGLNALACTRRDAPDWFKVWLRVNGRRFDWGTLRWCEMTGAPTGCYQAENATLHELGHVLGLDHQDDPNGVYTDAVMQVYSHAKATAGWNAHVYGVCDVATLQQQYDVPSSTTAYSVCLDVPTELSIDASRASVTAGAMVTFTATLGSNGTGRLSNNLVSGRTVVLQQRLASGWSDLATMGAASAAGTYTASVNVWATRDYRRRLPQAVERGPAWIVERRGDRDGDGRLHRRLPPVDRRIGLVTSHSQRAARHRRWPGTIAAGPRRARGRGVHREHRPVAEAPRTRRANASEGPSVQPGPTRAASATPEASAAEPTATATATRVVQASGRLPRRPDGRAGGGRARLVLVGRPRVRLALDRPADGVAPGPGAATSGPATWRACGREMDREMGQGAGTARRARPGSRDRAPERRSRSMRRLVPAAGACRSMCAFDGGERAAWYWRVQVDR